MGPLGSSTVYPDTLGLTPEPQHTPCPSCCHHFKRKPTRRFAYFHGGGPTTLSSVATLPSAWLNFSRFAHIHPVDQRFHLSPPFLVPGSIPADSHTSGGSTPIPYPPLQGSIPANTPTEHFHTNKVGGGSSLSRTSFFDEFLQL